MPVLAQQFVDSSTDGGGAFILFGLMVFIFLGLLFAIDRYRRGSVED